MQRDPTFLDVPTVAPDGSRPIASYNPAVLTPGVQAMAQGGRQLGAGIEQAGTDVAQVAVNRIRTQAVLAQDQGLGEAIALRQKYKHDQDFDTLPDRYGADLQGIITKATMGLPAGPIRDHVVARMQIPFAHELSQVQEFAFNGQKQVRAASRYKRANEIVDAVGPNTDDPLGNAAVVGFDQRVDEDVRGGWATPEQGAQESRQLALRVIDASARQEIKSGPSGAEKVIRDAGGLPAQDDIAGVPGTFLSHIKGSEGFAPRAQWDYRQFTNGYGTKASGPGEVISQATADQRFGDEITKAAKFVDSVNPNLDPGTRAALTSLTFNAGGGWADAGLGAKVRAGDIEGAKRVFQQYTKAGGKDLPTLVERRTAESDWFGKSDVDAAPAIRNKAFAILAPSHRDSLISEARTALSNYRNQDNAQAALERYNLQSAIRSDLASMATSGQGLDQTPNDRIRDVLGPVAFAQWQDDRNTAHSLWTATHDFATMPEADIHARLDAIAPQPGAPDYARQQGIAEEAKKRADLVLTQRREDPAGSMANDPAVKAALGQYDQNNPETFKPVAAARMAAQERAGLDEEYRSPITKQEALQLTAPLRTMLPGEERQKLTELGEKFKQLFGDNADTAFAYALRAHKVDAATAQLAARVMRKLGLGQATAEADARQLDDTHEIDAAQRAVNGTGFAASGLGTMGEAGNPNSAPMAAKPFGPDLPSIKPRAIEYLLAHPESAARFDIEFARPGLAKSILEKYSAAAGRPGGALGDLITGAP